ncbi:hydroxymethylpyrimidine/phosphomethylpyrimidine kinase [Marivirga tractuosa]|uniref:hydroxymethylpyrimidine/phosphomethylpyrimidine kinase n=1 Tax=Marivirga tractuosa TaxID=1006 RepID=UPI0035CE8CC7
MDEVKNHVLSIAGFDPSGGAGVLADVKTFEANKMQGMGIISALTFQNDREFDRVQWIAVDEILQQYEVLNRRFKFSVVKIGLVENFEVLEAILAYLKASTSDCLFIWDPILKASAGFEFHKNIDHHRIIKLLKNFSLITPNTDEIKLLTRIDNEMEAAKELTNYCPVLLKGGHSKKEPGTDYLFMDDKIEQLKPYGIDASPKHGSGCVLSSAITAQLAKGENLLNSCLQAKKYTELFLSSNTTLLGTHNGK